MSFIQRTSSEIPLDYVTPSFPALYWPIPIRGVEANYLYHANDIWRFTAIWSLLLFEAIHLAVAGWACAVQWRNWKIIWITPVIYAVIGGIEALIAGSIVGGLLGAVYNSGVFRMSTWIPFTWAVINALVLILSSFALHGGL